VARPQGGWFAAVFYPFGHPMPYTYVDRPRKTEIRTANISSSYNLVATVSSGCHD
jgi:hypothetical protein